MLGCCRAASNRNDGFDHVIADAVDVNIEQMTMIQFSIKNVVIFFHNESELWDTTTINHNY